MNPNPFVGVLFHWLGGLASGSFYVPFRGIRKWSWETYWLVGGIFAWILCPWLLAFVLTNDLVGVLRHQDASTLWWTGFFGAMWGFGGLTFGLTMRYLGMSLGMGVALGYCAAFGTLLPPLIKSLSPRIPVAESFGAIASSGPGQITLAGVAVCLLGIGIATLAGLAKERQLSAREKREAIAEFDFRKGMAMATFAGVMSACFAFGLMAGRPIGDASAAAGTSPIWTGLPKLTIVLFGGFLTNLAWCVTLNIRHKSGGEYLRTRSTLEREVSAVSPAKAAGRVPLLANYLLCALAGTTWYFQFFFYTMGETQMGQFGFASWTLHMASIIIFSTAWGWAFREWRGSGRKAHGLIALSVVLLVLSTVAIGYGSYLKANQ